MPTIDIPTIYLLAGFSSLLASAILLWLRGDHRNSGHALSLFIGSVLTLGAGFVCFAARGIGHGTMMAILGYTSIGAAAVLNWQACARLFGAKARPRVAVLALLTYFGALMNLHEPTAQHAVARMAVNAGFMVAFMGLSARLAHRSRWISVPRSVRLMRNVMVFFSGVFAVRVFAFLLHVVPMHADGSAPPSLGRLVFALLLGSLPMAIAFAAFSIANSQLSALLRKTATTDPLTGLLTRGWLLDSGSRLLEHRSEQSCMALLMIDLDNFKTINDRHGHSGGDEVLCHVATVLRDNLRPGDFVARYGGDEFCALVSVPGEAAAFVLAERVRAAMEARPHLINGEPVPLTLSIGVTVHRQGASLRQTLDEADKRAYRAKASGRNRVIGIGQPVAA
jgi:diguanylate cyclase (GGDEF)-like protein